MAGIKVTENTLWKRIEIAIFAYFSHFNNKPSTYREIARAYVSSSYSNYQKSCESLLRRGYLKKSKESKYSISKSDWPNIKRGIEIIERKLPYFETNKKKLNRKSNYYLANKNFHQKI